MYSYIIYTQVCICMYVCVFVCIYVCVRICMCGCVCTDTYVYFCGVGFLLSLFFSVYLILAYVLFP